MSRNSAYSRFCPPEEKAQNSTFNTERRSGRGATLHIHAVSAGVPTRGCTRPVYSRVACTYRIQGRGYTAGTVRVPPTYPGYTGPAPPVLLFSGPAGRCLLWGFLSFRTGRKVSFMRFLSFSGPAGRCLYEASLSLRTGRKVSLWSFNLLRTVLTSSQDRQEGVIASLHPGRRRHHEAMSLLLGPEEEEQRGDESSPGSW